jgi:phytoene synthase
MQLTNIARDVGEDARAGRLYLPLAWLREEGIDPEAWMMQPVFDARIARVVQRLLDDADALYLAAERGIAHLPLSCRPGIHAARLLYAHIGRAVEAAGCDSVSSRAVVPLRTKLRLLLRAVATIPLRGSADLPACSPSAQFLIDAVAADPRSAAAIPVRWWDVEARFAWLLHLFARLGQRDRFERAPAGEGRSS